MDRLLARIAPPDAATASACRAKLDLKTKPRGSLGRLEEVAVQVAALTRDVSTPVPRAAIVVAAADHGVADEGVSAYPAEVTPQMVANFSAGGAAVNVLARRAGADLVVVDTGVAVPCDGPLVRSLRFGAGTANMASGPAMPEPVAIEAVLAGAGMAAELAADGVGLIGIGEMGIGNSTSASAIAAAMLGLDPALTTGKGTGLDEEGLEHKAAVVRRALAANPQASGDPVATLAALGGFEIAFLTGVVLGSAAARIPVLLDGFITSASALIAARLASASITAMIASHLSPEPGHQLVLDALELEPLLDLGMRLGEGSGAALAIPVVQSALAILNEMASFDSAGVTDAGR
jgi:nicotinate-nucleotide--dimethylbenzimidazole phosphoribosyltransferase